MGSRMKVRKNGAMELAAKTAVLSEHPQHKIGCVITDRNDNLLSIGFNSFKTHPLQKKYGGHNKIHLHAEILALSRTNKGSPHSAYIVRIRRNGSLGMAKPCAHCAVALSEFGIKNIYWSE